MHNYELQSNEKFTPFQNFDRFPQDFDGRKRMKKASDDNDNAFYLNIDSLRERIKDAENYIDRSGQSEIVGQNKDIIKLPEPTSNMEIDFKDVDEGKIAEDSDTEESGDE